MFTLEGEIGVEPRLGVEVADGRRRHPEAGHEFGATLIDECAEGNEPLPSVDGEPGLDEGQAVDSSPTELPSTESGSTAK